MNYREQIGQRIAQLRKEKGLTQEDLSKLTGLNRTNITKIEKGKYNTGIDIIGKIADALGVEIKLIEKAAYSAAFSISSPKQTEPSRRHPQSLG